MNKKLLYYYYFYVYTYYTYVITCIRRDCFDLYTGKPTIQLILVVVSRIIAANPCNNRQGPMTVGTIENREYNDCD